jgi:hypothetical protein
MVATKEGTSRVSSDIAVVRHHRHIIQLLLKFKADPSVTYNHITVWGHLVMGIQKLIAPRSLCSANIHNIKLLLQKGADPNSTYNYTKVESIWEAVVHAMYLPSADHSNTRDEQKEVWVELIRCLHLHGANPFGSISLSLSTRLPLSKALKTIFSTQQISFLKDIMQHSQQHRKMLKVCGCVPLQSWGELMSFARIASDPLW